MLEKWKWLQPSASTLKNNIHIEKKHYWSKQTLQYSAKSMMLNLPHISIAWAYLHMTGLMWQIRNQTECREWYYSCICSQQRLCMSFWIFFPGCSLKKCTLSSLDMLHRVSFFIQAREHILLGALQTELSDSIIFDSYLEVCHKE